MPCKHAKNVSEIPFS